MSLNRIYKLSHEASLHSGVSQYEVLLHLIVVVNRPAEPSVFCVQADITGWMLTLKNEQ